MIVRLRALGVALLLVACTQQNPAGHQEHTVPQGGSFTVEDLSDALNVRFVVKSGDAVLQSFGVNHTKEMHLVIVRSDLRYFQHLHPTRDANGVWHAAFNPQFGGTYWLYADFVETNGTSHVIRFVREYKKDSGEAGVVKDFGRAKIFYDYTVQLHDQVEFQLAGKVVTTAFDWQKE